MKKALIVVDVQNDFCAQGALAVPGGEGIIIPVNLLMERFAGDTIVLTQDWHPQDHSSFAVMHEGCHQFDSIEMPYGPQTLWPTHCVQGTHGAAFHEYLKSGLAHICIRKGYRRTVDSYSAFAEADKTLTGLDGYLGQREIDRVYICGLALDYCVAYSAIDCVHIGFETFVVEDACRAINLNDSLYQAKARMVGSGVKFVRSMDVR